MKRRGSIAEVLEGSNDWPKAAVTHLSVQRQKIYKRNHDALIALRDTTASVKTVAASNGMSRDEIYRLIERACQKHKDGQIWGWRALVPYSSIRSYTREKELPANGSKGYAGAFMALIAKYPELAVWIDANFFRKGQGGSVVRKTNVKKLHRSFLEKVRSVFKSRNIPTADTYPFNKRHAGQRSLFSYVANLENDKRLTDQLSDQAELAALLSRRLVDGKQMVATRPFEVVQADGHELKLDVKLKIKRPDGSTFEITVPRMWLIAFMDVYSRAILGYTLVPYENYNASDVLSAAANALYGRPERFSLMEGSGYPGFSLPVEKEPKLAGVSWDILSFDNAMAHLAKDVAPKLLHIVNCAICRGMPGVPEFRAYIERAFKRIQESGGLAHLAASRYGRRAVKPGQAVHLEFLLPLIDSLIWEYNFEIATEANYGRIPFEALLEARGDIFTRKVGAANWGRSHFTRRRIKKTVRGNVNEAQPPYIEFHDARYAGKPLLERPELIGKSVYFEYDEDDVLWANVYSERGHELGRIKAMGSRWGRRPHSLRLRKHILQMIDDAVLRVPEGMDALSAWEQFVRKSTSPISTRARAAAAERSMRPKPQEEGPRPSSDKRPKPTAPVFMPVSSRRRAYKI